MIVDSGNRREFGTGAVRDMAEGKGRCDLMPWSILARTLSEDENLYYVFCMKMDDACRGKDVAYSIQLMIKITITEFFNGDKPTAFLELAKHFEEGCQKYGERNWEQGIPLSVYLDSAGRHFWKLLRADNDERHDRALLWNLVCAAWTNENFEGE